MTKQRGEEKSEVSRLNHSGEKADSRYSSFPQIGVQPELLSIEINADRWVSRCRGILGKRLRLPHKWRWPLSEKLDLSIDDLKKQHDQVSRAINRLLLALIAFSFFCVLALGAPDRSILASDAEIRLPFASTAISFVYFLFLGPLVLVAFAIYLHILIEHWIELSHQTKNLTRSDPALSYAGLPFVFNLQNPLAGLLTYVLFYWLVPFVLAGFMWKVLPRPAEARGVIFCLFAVVVVLLYLQQRRWPEWENELCVASIILTILLLAEAISGITRSLNLYKADLKDLDLRGVNLSGADMKEADLSAAQLASANLCGVNLTDAQLARADLLNTRLEWATLVGANLSGTNMTDAVLSRADLTRAQLDHTSLVGANLQDAVFGPPSEIYNDSQDWRGNPLTTVESYGMKARKGRPEGTTLEVVDLEYSDLRRANLGFSHLKRVDLQGALLDGAVLSYADLGDVQGLTQEQVNSALGDEHTKLPSGIRMPNSWRHKQQPVIWSSPSALGAVSANQPWITELNNSSHP